jgi:hypothetical protein
VTASHKQIRVKDRRKLRGFYRVKAVDRETGEVIRTSAWRPNAITTAGRNIFLDIMRGNTSSDYFDNANTQLRIFDGSPGTLVKTITGADSGFPTVAESGSNVEATWQFSDISVDEYDATRLEIRNRAGGSGTVIFSDSVQSFGSKPNTQNWIYEYKLILSNVAIAPFGDGTNIYTGVPQLLDMFTGDQIDSYDEDTQLFVEGSSSGTYSQTADGAPSRTDQTVTWTFTVIEGNGNSPNNWNFITIRKTLIDCTDCRLRRDDEGWPAKQSNEQRTVTYEFSV